MPRKRQLESLEGDDSERDEPSTIQDFASMNLGPNEEHAGDDDVDVDSDVEEDVDEDAGRASEADEPASGSEPELEGDMSTSETPRRQDDDPVVREYDVFLNEAPTERLMLLQYPNRHRKQPFLDSTYSKPTELRVKPGTGLVEVDIPMDIQQHYDPELAVRYGDALKKSTEDRAGGSLGLAGGFGVGVGPNQVGRRAATMAGRSQGRGGGPEITQEMLMDDLARAVNLGRVLDKQTLGGQTDQVNEGKPIYMVGAFRDDQLHLTPIHSIAQLRPQFHHLDAVVEQEKAASRPPRDPNYQPAPRAVQMMVKSADGEDVDTAEITRTLKAAQEEDWTRMQYADQDSPDAWVAYQRLFVRDTTNAPTLRPSITGMEYLDEVSASSVPTASLSNVKDSVPASTSSSSAKAQPSDGTSKSTSRAERFKGGRKAAGT